MSREALYFRLKRLRLGSTYERFLLDYLEPGGTIVIVDCCYSWPGIRVDDRHVFQVGGLGALDPSDYYGGGPRTREFLEGQGSPKLRWDVPSPTGDHPESEWGYAPELTSDVLRFADRHGYRVERLRFEDPEHLSPWVADLHREIIVPSCGATDRLIVESFFLTDPWCVQRTGSVPFWTAFNSVASADAVESYLDGVAPFDEIHAVLFSNGVLAPNTANADRWTAILRRALRSYDFLGVQQADYPRDFAVYFRYHDAFARLPDAPRPVETLRWSDVQTYATRRGVTQKAPVHLEYLND